MFEAFPDHGGSLSTSMLSVSVFLAAIIFCLNGCFEINATTLLCGLHEQNRYYIPDLKQDNSNKRFLNLIKQNWKYLKSTAPFLDVTA